MVDLKDPLVDDLRRKMGRAKLHGGPVEVRPYQLGASLECIDQLMKGKNVVMDLPTGTGKTMIANMVTYLWQRRCPSSPVLYVVPRRILIGQHLDHAQWLAPDLFPLAISHALTGNPGRYCSMLRTFDAYISTPTILANSVRSLVTDPAVFASIALVVVDEFDEFLRFEYQQYGTDASLKRDFESLYELFDERVRFLLMSATSPIKAFNKGSADRAVQTFSRFLVNSFEPHVLEVDEEEYRDYVPTARVRVVSVLDQDVVPMAQAIDQQIRFAFLEYRCVTGIVLDAGYLFPRLQDIIFGRIPLVRTEVGHWIAADTSVRKLCRGLQAALNQYNFLYEDLFADISWETTTRRIVCEDEVDLADGRPKFAEVPILVDHRENSDEYRAHVRSKFDCVRKIVHQRSGDSGVIFTRYIGLSDAISVGLHEMCISHTVVDGRVKGKELDNRIRDFRTGHVQLLVITRDTGKRGLDLPRADYAIFYSPKASELTVWQELSRIRSNIHRTKDSYFLVYGHTNESDKMRDLAIQMRVSGREYEIIEHCDPDFDQHLAEVSTAVRPRIRESLSRSPEW